MLSKLKSFPTELVIWIVGLTSLAFIDPHQAHYSFCPLNNLGFDFCPGCGLGKSISFLFRGDLKASVDAHWLGGFAVIVLSFRIINLTFNHIKTYGKTN